MNGKLYVLMALPFVVLFGVIGFVCWLRKKDTSPRAAALQWTAQRARAR